MKARIPFALLLVSQVLAGAFMVLAACACAVGNHDVIGALSCAALAFIGAHNACWCVRRIRERYEE